MKIKANENKSKWKYIYMHEKNVLGMQIKKKNENEEKFCRVLIWICYRDFVSYVHRHRLPGGRNPLVFLLEWRPPLPFIIAIFTIVLS